MLALGCLLSFCKGETVGTLRQSDRVTGRHLHVVCTVGDEIGNGSRQVSVTFLGTDCLFDEFEEL